MIARDHSQTKTHHPRGVLALGALTTLLLVLGACSGGDAKQTKTDGGSEAQPAAHGSATSKADMPGMRMDAGAESSAKGGDAGGKETSVTFMAAQVQHGQVQWGRAEQGAAAGSAVVPGQLVPNEDRTARIGAPAGGRVVRVSAQPGARVARGAELVTIQSPEAGAAQSDVDKARAEVTARRAQAQYARTARERAERLLALKAIPRQDYERAVADDDAAQASLTQANAELRRALSTAQQLGAGVSATGVISIRTPLAGVVLARSAVPGAVVEAGAPLVVVTDPGSLWLQINAPEKLAPLFRRGDTVRFNVPAYPGQPFAARVDAVGAGLDPETRTLPVRALVASDGRLKAEMLATVSVTGVGTVAAVVIPDDAVQTLEGTSVVFVATPDGKGGARFEARPVEIAARTGGRVAVTRGIAPGELVVTHGAFAVKAQLRKGSEPEMKM